MAYPRHAGHEPAHGLVRHRRAARRRGDHDPRALPVAPPRVTLYHAPDCRLCERALEVVRAARDELGFELVLVDVSGDPELEARYRAYLPVVEIDGERAFTYFVEPDALRGRLGR